MQFLDEADEMLNMGFYEDITEIFPILQMIKALGCLVQRCLREVSQHIARKSLCITQLRLLLALRNVGSSQVSHEYYLVNARDRYASVKAFGRCTIPISFR